MVYISLFYVHVDVFGLFYNNFLFSSYFYTLHVLNFATIIQCFKIYTNCFNKDVSNNAFVLELYLF